MINKSRRTKFFSLSVPSMTLLQRRPHIVFSPNKIIKGPRFYNRGLDGIWMGNSLKHKLGYHAFTAQRLVWPDQVDLYRFIQVQDILRK
jgi:hypothetical protein